MSSQHVAILGNGIAGITCARFVRKLTDWDVTVISAETDHFFSRTALMYIYMGHMRYQETKPYEDWFWEKHRIDLVRDRVTELDLDGQRLLLENGDPLAWDKLLLATGSNSRLAGWPGQDLDGVQGLYSYPDLERMETNTTDHPVERAVIVGGGLIGIEMTEMLLTRDIPVTFLVREPSWMSHLFPPEESEMINREIRRHGVDLRLATELERIEGDDRGRVRSVVTTDGEEIPCQFVGLTIGVTPNIDFLQGSGLETDRGILADEHLRTSHPAVWTAGDCAQLREPPPGRRPVEPVWYTGRAMGEVAAYNIAGQPTMYDPGVWFNSAKFFDIEWQIYGEVPGEVPEGQDTLVWHDHDLRRAIRINYRRDDLAVTGFNLLGIRYRHALCERWIDEETPVPEVLADLGAANFDPELYRQHERQLVELWNRTHPDHRVEPRRRRGLAGFLSLLGRRLRAS